MVALTGDEAEVLRDCLAQAGAARSAGGTLTVSANASTSVTFTDAEKAAVVDVLAGWLELANLEECGGLFALMNALAQDLGRA